jgi:hypothetical protein
MKHNNTATQTKGLEKKSTRQKIHFMSKGKPKRKEKKNKTLGNF